jgi:hypothetical protein
MRRTSTDPRLTPRHLGQRLQERWNDLRILSTGVAGRSVLSDNISGRAGALTPPGRGNGGKSDAHQG